jgi:hypothetical protein
MSGLCKFLRLLLIILSVQLSIREAVSQTPVNLRSTLSISGSSRAVTTAHKDLFIQQVIGQSGVIGLANASTYQLRQGFIQPLESSKTIIETGNLQVRVSPNPSPGEIRILFTELISDELYVSLSNLSGITVYFNRFPASQEITLNFGSLPPALYIIKVYTDKKYYISKLIRE